MAEKQQKGSQTVSEVFVLITFYVKKIFAARKYAMYGLYIISFIPKIAMNLQKKRGNAWNNFQLNKNKMNRCIPEKYVRLHTFSLKKSRMNFNLIINSHIFSSHTKNIKQKNYHQLLYASNGKCIFHSFWMVVWFPQHWQMTL